MSDSAVQRSATGIDIVYSEDWRNWTDPEVPEYFNPTELLLDRHLATDTATKTALGVDGADYSYAALAGRVNRAASALKSEYHIFSRVRCYRVVKC